MKRTNFIVVSVLLLSLMGLTTVCMTNPKDLKKAVTLHIFSSTNITGNLEPCG